MSFRSALIVIPTLGLLAGLVGCASTPQAPAAATPAAAPSTSSAVTHAELLRRQERLTPVAREIQDLVDPLEGPRAKPLPSGENRYGVVRIDSELDRVELWWAGPLPEEVRVLLARYPDIHVEVYRSKFSNNELHAASDTIARYLRGGSLGLDVTTDAIEHDVLRGRLTVHVIDPLQKWTVEDLHRHLDPLTAVPLDIVHQSSSTLHPL